MKTREMTATLEGDIKVLSVNRLRGTVTLLVEGQRMTLRPGDDVALTLNGRFTSP